MYTFLFTDIEGSTRLWEEQPEMMRVALARHDVILSEIMAACRGRIVKTTGDGLHVVFTSPRNGLAAVLAAQRALIAEPWPSATALRVRMALYTGEAEERAEDFYGPAVNRAARLMSAAVGGQVLLSAATAELVRDELTGGLALRDLGEHHLRDLTRPERVYQLVAPDLPADFPPLRTLSTVRHNLPLQTTSFVGRERELAEALQLLLRTRLLTLVGPGGTGKTRLSLQCAVDSVAQYGDGVWLAELAPVSDPALIAQTAAMAVGIREQSSRPILEVLTEHLRPRKMLLLLDNCEHVIRAAAVLADHLLRACPGLTILVTSREPLGISGETIFRVPTLGLPEGSPALRVAQIAGSDAVQLFVARAGAISPGFVLNDENAAAIAEICRRLDGIPLAIELAAARVRVLSVSQIAARLNDRFRLLTGGDRLALPRQQTLRALIDWSWELLTEPERTLLRRLSIFSGGWTLEAAETICADEENTGAVPALETFDVLDLIDQLVNKSLLIVTMDRDAARYKMLESVRDYAAEKLAQAGDTGRIGERHLDYFLALVRTAELSSRGAQMQQWFDRLEDDIDNLRLAIERGIAQNPTLALRMSGALGMFWTLRGYWSEGRTWVLRALDAAGPIPPGATPSPEEISARAGATTTFGMLAAALGDVQTFSAEMNDAIALARQSAKPHLLAFALAVYALAKWFHGDFAAADKLAAEAVEISRLHGFHWELSLSLALLAVRPAYATGADRHMAAEQLAESRRLAGAIGDPWILALSVFMEALFAQQSADWERARAYLEQSRRLFQAINNRHYELIARSELAHQARRLRQPAEAKSHYRETIVGWREMGNEAAVAHQIECFAFLALLEDKPGRAARLLGAAEAIRQRIGSLPTPIEMQETAEALSSLEAQLGREALSHELESGHALTTDQALELALEAEL